MTNYEELARAAITAELSRQITDDESEHEAYTKLLGDIIREHPLVILNITHYAATALATACGGFEEALEMWRLSTLTLAQRNCEHGYFYADCDECEDLGLTDE